MNNDKYDDSNAVLTGNACKLLLSGRILGNSPIHCNEFSTELKRQSNSFPNYI